MDINDVIKEARNINSESNGITYPKVFVRVDEFQVPQTIVCILESRVKDPESDSYLWTEYAVRITDLKCDILEPLYLTPQDLVGEWSEAYWNVSEYGPEPLGLKQGVRV